MTITQRLMSQPTTLTAAQTIPAGALAVLFGKLTIPSTYTLTISSTGFVVFTNTIPGL